MPSIKTPQGKSFSFDPNQTAEFQKQLRFGDGGTLIRDFHRAKLTGDFMLVVGLGGLGTKTVSRIKTAVKRECDEVHQDRVRYLALDTDAGSLKQLCNTDHSKVGLEWGTETVQLGQGVTGSFDKLYQDADPIIKKWLNPNLKVPELSQTGASQTRQLGRFLLSKSFYSVNNVLTKTLTEMSAAYSSEAANGAQFTVVLAAGIAGGTGAGTFVDMAYIIRNVLEKTAPKATLSGYLFLPDVLQKQVPYPTGDSSRMLRRNTYASLKELDRYMRIDEDKIVAVGGIPGNQAEYVLEYPGGVTIRSSKNIFDYCTLVCGQSDAAGVFADPLEKALSTAASSIVEALKAVPKKDDNGNVTETLLTSVLSNQTAAGVQMAAQMPANLPKDADYRYQAIGFGSARLPLEECVAYVGDKLFDKMWQQWDRTPLQQDVLNFCTNAAFDPTSVRAEAITSPYNLSEESSWPAMRDAENSSLAALQTNFQGRVDAFMAAKARSWQVVLENRKKAFDEEAQVIFKNPKLGPHYLVRLLVGYMAKDERPVVDYIDTEYISRLRAARVTAQAKMKEMDINRSVESAYLKFTNAMRLFKGGAYKDMMNALAAYYTEYEKIRLADTQIEFYENLINYIIGTNNKVWSVYTTVIGECAALLKENADIATDAEAHVSIGGSSYSWTIVDLKNKSNPATARLLKYLDTVVDQTDQDRFLENMVNEMSEKREEWTGIADNKGADALASAIRAFLRNQLGGLVNMNIDSFIAAAYVDNNVADIEKAKKDAALKIFNTVKAEALPIFRSTPNVGLDTFLTFNYLSIPAAAPTLLTNMTALQNGSNNVKIYSSTAGDKVVQYTLVYGIPPYALGIIKECEEEYYSISDAVGGSAGLHLSESSAVRSLNWHGFANPFNKELWTRFGIYSNQLRLNAQEANNKKLIETAIEYGIIEQAQDVSGKTVFNMSFIPAIGEGLARNANIEDGRAVPIDILLKKLAVNGNMAFDKKGYISGLISANKGKSITVNADVYKEYANAYGAATGNAAVTTAMANLYGYYQPITAEMLANELRASLERQQYLEVAIADYEEVINAVREHNEKMAERGMLPSFVDYLRFGIIFNDTARKTWYYDDGSTRNNVLCSYMTGAAINRRYPVYFAFKQFCEADAQVKTKLQKVLGKEEKLRLSDITLGEQDEQRTADMTAAFESVIFGEEPFQFGSFDIEDNLASINALDEKDDILKFYKDAKSILS